MAEKVVTEDLLERLLRGAEEAHAEYERQTGTRDENWPAWYAQWIMERLPGR